MNKLNKEKMKTIKGGAGVSPTLINALARAVSTMFSIGQAVGSAIRRTLRGSYC